MDTPAPKSEPENVESKAKAAPKKASKRKTGAGRPVSAPAKFPRHSIDKALRIPKAILEQNAGKECSEEESAKFVGVGYHGPYRVEVSSGLKFGLLARPSEGRIAVTERAKQIIRPQSPSDALKGMREAVLSAPVIQDVYGHYRGENLPDPQFFNNALTDKFGVPADKVDEFRGGWSESRSGRHRNIRNRKDYRSDLVRDKQCESSCSGTHKEESECFL